jgi:membrane protein
MATLGMSNFDQHGSRAVAYSRYISQMASIGARVPCQKRAEWNVDVQLDCRQTLMLPNRLNSDLWHGPEPLFASCELRMISPKNPINLLRRSFNQWCEHDAPQLGAALAFYAILSISPLVIFAMAMVSSVVGRSQAQAQLLDEVQTLVGPDGRGTVQTLLVSGQKRSSGIFATLAGFAILLFGASGVFGELRSALNRIWEAKPESSSGIWGILRKRVFSIGMVFSVGFPLLISLLVSTGLAALTRVLRQMMPLPPFLMTGVDFLISFLAIAMLFGLILKYVPEATIQWKEVRIGALFTALLLPLASLSSDSTSEEQLRDSLLERPVRSW